jgi:hypothetical protein
VKHFSKNKSTSCDVRDLQGDSVVFNVTIKKSPRPVGSVITLKRSNCRLVKFFSLRGSNSITPPLGGRNNSSISPAPCIATIISVLDIKCNCSSMAKGARSTARNVIVGNASLVLLITLEHLCLGTMGLFPDHHPTATISTYCFYGDIII